MDRLNLPEMPSHGGNTGSNPVGDANYISDVWGTDQQVPKNFPKSRSWTVVGLAPDPVDRSKEAAKMVEGSDTIG